MQNHMDTGSTEGGTDRIQQQIAAYASGLTYEALIAEAKDAAKKRIIDILAGHHRHRNAMRHLLRCEAEHLGSSHRTTYAGEIRIVITGGVMKYVRDPAKNLPISMPSASMMRALAV